MTAPATTRRAGPFDGNSVATSFPFYFKVFAASDIAVSRTAAGLDDVLTLGSDYSVTLNADQDTSPGGFVTYPLSGAPLSAVEKLTIIGALPYDQPADLPSGGNYRAVVIENALDRTVMQVQQLAEELGRSLTLPASAATADTELPAPEANKVIGWNETGTALVNLDSADLATVVVAGTSYTDVFSGTGVQTQFVLTANPGSVNALDIAISGAAQINGVDFTASGTTLTFISPPPPGAGNIAVRYVAAVPVGSANAQDVSYTAAGAGAVSTTQREVNERRVSVFDFMTAAQIADVKAGTASLDVSAAVQAWIAVVESDAQYGAPKGYAPRGLYRLDSAPQFTKQYVTVEGDGMFATRFQITGATDGLSVVGTYWRPTLRDFAVIGGATSLHAIDMSGAGTVYNSAISNLYLVSGDTAFYGGPTTILFSAEVSNVVGGSYAGHFIHTNNGPSTNFRGCYGFFAGPNKALYRMAGNVHLDGCNGGNDPGFDYWGVFGNDTASADGFQGDFATADYADVLLIGCNVEYFGSLTANIGTGLRFQSQLRGFKFIGGKFDRSALATPYRAVIHARAGMNSGSGPFVLEPAWFQPGGGALGLASLACDTTEGHFFDANGQVAAGGVTTCRRGANTYPTLKDTLLEDVFLGTAFQPSASSPRRLTLQTQRYKTVLLTPVGAGQVLVVTGHCKVIVTPAAAASVTTATFDATAGADLDYGRNGELVVEAGNGNLTVNHTARGGAANTFVMAGGANVTLAAGQIVRFLRSETGSQWQQV